MKSETIVTSIFSKSKYSCLLYCTIQTKIPKIFNLPSGLLTWKNKYSGETLLFYDPSRIVIEFFVGGGSTLYCRDTEQVHRMVVDSDFSKAQMKRAHRSPYYSGRYALEWHGRLEPMEVPFPDYRDDQCVVAAIKDKELILPDNSLVPQLEKTSNIAQILFVESNSDPLVAKDLKEFLSRLVPQNRLVELIDRMFRAYTLRKEAGSEKPYKGLGGTWNIENNF